MLPEIIAHRGASRDCFENTLPAFALALDQGADGVELDVHATRDHVVVVHHDAVIPRRVGGRVDAVPISAITASALSTYRLPSGDPIPTLAEVFELIGDRAMVWVEVKGRNIEVPVVKVLNAYPNVRHGVHSFDHRIPVAVRRLRTQTAIGLLSASYPLDVRGVLADSGATAFWQESSLIDVALVDAVHAAGARLIAWTENNAPHARELTAWGVDALCTDTPGAIRTALAAAAGRGAADTEAPATVPRP